MADGSCENIDHTSTTWWCLDSLMLSSLYSHSVVNVCPLEEVTAILEVGTAVEGSSCSAKIGM